MQHSACQLAAYGQVGTKDQPRGIFNARSIFEAKNYSSTNYVCGFVNPTPMLELVQSSSEFLITNIIDEYVTRRASA
jgi:hypothetical protein